MKKLSKAVVICIAGHTIEKLEELGHLKSMKTVMLGDRIFDRACECKMIVLDGMTKLNSDLLKANWQKHLATVYNEGYTL